MKKFLKPKLIFFMVGLVTVLGTGLYLLPVGAQSSSTLRSQMETVSKSASAKAVRTQLGNLVSDPALGKWAAELTTQGGTSMTSFQRDLLKAVETESRYGDVLAKRLNGTQLSGKDYARLTLLQNQLPNNPAIQRLLLAGKQLKKSSALGPDISEVVSTINGPVPTTTPTGDNPRDAVLGDLSSVIHGSSFTALSSSITPILSNSGAPALVSTLPPEAVATFLPPAQTFALLLPNDHDPATLDTFKAGWEIAGGIGALMATVALAPEVLTISAIIGITGGLIAGLSGIIVGTIDLGQALDCDHDGDAWDTGESAEC